MHTQNLIKLANYLAALPETYDKFNMVDFIGVKNFRGDIEELQLRHPTKAVTTMSQCGTVACALGHGTLVAGLESTEADQSWWQYAERVFDVNPNKQIGEATLTDHLAFVYMFDAGWADFDNTAQGAAQRIAALALHPGGVTNIMLGIWMTMPEGNRPFKYSLAGIPYIRKLAFHNSLEKLCESITFPVEI